MQLRMYLRKGFYMADCECTALASFLMDEITLHSKNYSAFVEAVRRGISDEDYRWWGTGNANTLTVRGSAITISNEYDEGENECVLGGNQMLVILDKWLMFLDDGQEVNFIVRSQKGVENDIVSPFSTP